MSQMTYEKMLQIIQKGIPLVKEYKNKGIYEIYENNGITLGISYEDLEKYESTVYENIYIFNLFYNDQYINIKGAYKILNNKFVDIEDKNIDLITIIVNKWNKLLIK